MKAFALAALVALGLTACTGGGRSQALPITPTPVPVASAAPSPTPTPVPALLEGPPSLTEPAGVAWELDGAEQAIRSEATESRWLPELAGRQQEAYRQLAAHPDWVPLVTSRVAPDVARIIQANVGADRELRALNEPVGKLPPWKIVAPPPPDELLGYYREAQEAFGVPWQYLASIHFIETSVSRIKGPSSAGALGPMQFIPSTWAQYGQGDINNNRDAILAAGRYLKAAGAPGNMPRAIYAYNHSQRYVRAVTLYAEQMMANPRAYLGYYYWKVYVQTTARGDVLLDEGYGS